MKKRLFLLLVMVLLVGILVACGDSNTESTNYQVQTDEAEPAHLSDHARTVGTYAVEIVDEFLDGEITAANLRKANDRLHELPNVPASGAPDDTWLDISLGLLQMGTWSIDDYNPTAEDIERIIGTRNGLAEMLDIPLR